jgi:hypothetical protein
MKIKPAEYISVLRTIIFIFRGNWAKVGIMQRSRYGDRPKAHLSIIAITFQSMITKMQLTAISRREMRISKEVQERIDSKEITSKQLELVEIKGQSEPIEIFQLA